MKDLHFSFDVGHSSLGWAVLKEVTGVSTIEVLGCGAVTFRADDCLASERRDYRRQRRHIRSTRQRIERMKLLLLHLGILTNAELGKPGCAWPWKLAARVLAGKSDAATLLSWPELWDVLRWYAHNRGYDGNRRWSNNKADASLEDSEKEANAHSLMDHYGTKTMSETVCAVCGIDPLGEKKSSNTSPSDRFKSKNAAFPREVVEEEVRRILTAHVGKINAMDDVLVRTLLGKDNKDKTAWKTIFCPLFKISARYEGSLLFGQLVPRFDNRIISQCPISDEKVPMRHCPEFLNFRWGMILANIRVGNTGDRDLRCLSAEERKVVNAAIRETGHFTAKELQSCVRKNTGTTRDNLETMFMHPDAKDALLVDPVRKLLISDKLKPFWPLLPLRLQKRISGQCRQGKTISLATICDQMRELGVSTVGIDAEIQRKLDVANTKVNRKSAQVTRGSILNERHSIQKLSGRAPYARSLLVKAFAEVMEGKHPKEEGNCLCITDEIRAAQLNRPISEQTNNHLVRHRLLILERLVTDMIKEYAGGNKERLQQLTIEVNRDLRDMSGMTAKEKAQELGQRLANHHAVSEKLEKALVGKTINGQPIQISAGLIRKARIADDLGWICPYTGQTYEPINLITRYVDKDHIVPRSERASDALDSLVVTFSAVNKWKGKRTAWQFVSDEQGKSVPDLPNLSIVSLARYRQFVESLEAYKGHDDDKQRKKRRKEFMLLPSYEEKAFTPRDLTQTSQLVRLGAQALRRLFSECKEQPQIISLPGSVTGTVRKSWKALGCLALANPQVMENGEMKSKTEIRDVTHLHHALDACVLGLAAHFTPNSGRVWELIVKRNPNNAEQRELMELGVFGRDSEGRFQMRDLDSRLKEQIRQRLAEKRIVQHIPSRMDGLRLEQNIWRVVSVSGDNVTLQQRMRAPDGTLPKPKLGEEKASKLLGLNPSSGTGKLRALKGVLIIPDNFGVALDPQPAIIPFHKVWTRLAELRAANAGKWPRVLRNGQIIEVPNGGFKGVWRVFSAKNNATGIMLDIGHPDVVRLKNKTPGHKINVRLSTLLTNGMRVVKTPLTGMACPTTLSA